MDDNADFMFQDMLMHHASCEDYLPHISGQSEPHADYLSAQGEHSQSDVHPHTGHGIQDFALKLLGPAAIHFGEEMGWLDSTADIDLWHLQHHDDTCAIVAQEFVLESLTGHSFSENELMQEAYSHGWYSSGGGTPMEHVGDLLQAHGIHIERGHGYSLETLQAQLDQGHKVIVGVNGQDIWQPHTPTILETILTGVGFMPGQQADHAVQVVSIDKSDPTHPIVVLNDSGTPGGAGERVSLSTFEQAWATSDHFMVSAQKA